LNNFDVAPPLLNEVEFTDIGLHAHRQRQAIDRRQQVDRDAEAVGIAIDLVEHDGGSVFRALIDHFGQCR
jgi:hypothetical protein